MENLAHTLFGLALAKAGLERTTPLATTALVISSNLPDIDVVVRARGITAYLEHHRGLTHSLVGLAVLAGLLAFLLAYLDRKFRLRRDPFRRPVRPARLFAVSLVGGLGHLFMDFTNSYGVRPLLPFSRRWFYGDLAFVVDPWLWLILGSAAVWLTTSAAARSNSRVALRAVFWLVVAALTSLTVALASRNTDAAETKMPAALRVIWFAGLVVIIAGAVLGWGRAGARLARYSIVLLALYYGALWIAHQTAREKAGHDLPAETASVRAAWPTPANPMRWQGVASDNEFFYTRFVTLGGSADSWREMAAPDPALVGELRQWDEARVFLDFARYAATTEEKISDDGQRVLFRDFRFPLQMSVELDGERHVRSVAVRWF
jgi:inner membrane protein